MKKVRFLFLTLALTLTALVFSVSASAAETATPEKYFYYSIVNKEVIIYSIDNTLKGHLVIPEKIKGYPVVEVRQDNHMFEPCYDITEITLPSTIKRVGELGLSPYFERVNVDSLETWMGIEFSGLNGNPLSCSKLYIGGNLVTEIVIPEGVTEIKDYTFDGIASVESITLPESLEILGSGSFAYSGIKSVNIKSVGWWIDLVNRSVAAGKNSGLADLIGPYTTVYVNGEAIVDLVIPEGVTTVADGVFANFDSVESVSFPSTIKSIGANTFWWCNKLKSVYVPDVATWFNVCTVIMRNLSIDSIYIDNQLLVDLVIPEDIHAIPTAAFRNYTKLESISMSAPVNDFGYEWAYGCTNFKTIYADSYETWINCNFSDGSDNPLSKVDYLYIDGKAVVDYVIPEGSKRISAYAFCGYKALKSITIPAGMEIMEPDAFENSGLENVYVESLEAWFETCRLTVEASKFLTLERNPMNVAKNLYIAGEKPVDLVIPESITSIPRMAFYNVQSIRSIKFHNKMEETGGAFTGCKNIREIYVPDFETWTKVNGARGDSKLETIYINNEPVVDFVVPEGVTSLPLYCFKNYEKLESITIGSGLESIGTECFLGCTNLKNVYVDSFETWMNLSFESDSANPMCVAENLYIAGKNIENLVIDESMTSIPENAFLNCPNIKTVTIHSGLTSIGKDAFKNCTGIEKVYAPSLEAWLAVDFASAAANPLHKGAELYIGGELLEVLEVPEAISEIKSYAFYGYGYIRRFNITGAPLTINFDVFGSSCKGMEIHAQTLEDWLNVSGEYAPSNSWNPTRHGAILYIGGKEPTEIVIPESVKKIPAYAFQNCSKLKKVTIPATVTVGTRAFMDCTLDEVVLGSLTQKSEPVMQVTGSMFSRVKSVGKIIFGYGVKSIADSAFEVRASLKEIELYSGIESIGESAFYGTGITSVTIPSSVKTVGKRAFHSCTALKSATFGDSVSAKPQTKIGDYAFYNCKNIEAVTFNSAVISIGEKAFNDSNAIKTIHINDLVSYLAIDIDYFGQRSNPMWIASEDKKVYINGKELKNLVIPEGVTSICSYAFYNCESLETVKFPSTLKKIGEGAFSNCYSLKNFTLPESLEEIGDFAFFCCDSITKLELVKKLDSVGMDAFGYCRNLEVVYMYPEQLDIEESAFWECKNIKVVLYTGTQEGWLKLLEKNKRKTGLENVAVYYRYNPSSMLAPENLTASQSLNSITLKWSKINGVTGYRIYVKNGDSWKTVKTVTQNTYTVTGLAQGAKYTYAVKAYINTGSFVLWSPNYTTLDTATKTAKISKVTAAQNTSAIKLTWTACKGATGYRIYYKSGGVWKVCVSTTSATSHTFKNLRAGAKYTFAIRPYIKNGSTVVWSDYVEFTTATKPATVTAKVSSTSKGKASLSWNQVNGADGYQIFYKTGNGAYKLYKTVNKNTKNLSISNLKSGTKYTFVVRAGIKSSGGNIYGAYKETSVTVR